MDLEKLLRELGEKGGSDLHFKAGRPPLFRVAGELTPTSHDQLTKNDIQEAVLQAMSPAARKRFEERLDTQFSFGLPAVARFRVSVFVQRSEVGAVFRLIPLEVPTIDALGLPEILKTLASRRSGLVVVSGVASSGRSTTVASMMQQINRTRRVHIITIEDPIEFVFIDEMATISQRQLGADTRDFLGALRASLRQDPDVICVGEMRDPDVVSFALEAAESGRLVLATMQTNGAASALERIVDSFPHDRVPQARARLASVLRGAIALKLVRRTDGSGLVPAVEILVDSPQVKQALLDGATKELTKIAESDTHYGMQSFNEALLALVRDGTVTEEDALARSNAAEDLKLALRGVSKVRGGEVEGGGAGRVRRGFDL